MKTAITSTLAMSLVLAITACSPRMNDPDIKQNPHPKMRYDVTITVQNAPGPFDSVGGFMQYEVTNKACVPETGGPMNAMRIAPMSNPRIVFTKVANNVYRGAVYADYFQDEDYYGLGACHWSLMAVTAEVKVNKLSLVSHLSPDQLFSQKSVRRYFIRDDYDDNRKERGSSGEDHLTDYLRNRHESTFTIALIAKESAQ
jgi:hypothetical protein